MQEHEMQGQGWRAAGQTTSIAVCNAQHRRPATYNGSNSKQRVWTQFSLYVLCILDKNKESVSTPTTHIVLHISSYMYVARRAVDSSCCLHEASSSSHVTKSTQPGPSATNESHQGTMSIDTEKPAKRVGVVVVDLRTYTAGA